MCEVWSLGTCQRLHNVKLHEQNINWSRSHTQTSQSLQLTSPVLPTTSKCYQDPLELCKVLSDLAREFAGASGSTCCYEGVFRMLRDLPYRIVKCWSCWDLFAGLWETLRAAEISAQRCRRLGVILSHQWFLKFHNHMGFSLSYLSLLQSQNSLHHKLRCIIYLGSLYIYLQWYTDNGNGLSDREYVSDKHWGR